jgi:hypothetical protein
VSYRSGGTSATISRPTTRILDVAERMDRAELEEIEFAGWKLDRVIPKTSRAGRQFYSYEFTREQSGATL